MAELVSSRTSKPVQENSDRLIEHGRRGLGSAQPTVLKGLLPDSSGLPTRMSKRPSPWRGGRRFWSVRGLIGSTRLGYQLVSRLLDGQGPDPGTNASSARRLLKTPASRAGSRGSSPVTRASTTGAARRVSAAHPRFGGSPRFGRLPEEASYSADEVEAEAAVHAFAVRRRSQDGLVVAVP
jgi:hypothetical protein